MSKYTDFFNLFKWDTVSDSEEEFDIDKALNENWDKIDTKTKQHITEINQKISSLISANTTNETNIAKNTQEIEKKMNITDTYNKQNIDDKLNDKVDKVSGKQLSTNDYTNIEKEKLAGLENYILPIATSEILGGIKVGAGLEIVDGVLNVIVNIGTVDSELSGTSTNAVQNKVVKQALDNIVENSLTSTATDKALSAAKGKELNELINKSNVLWQGVTLMKEGQSVTLSENISAQKNGIALVWSVWNGSSAEDWGWQFNFVPKKFVELMSGKGSDFMIMGDEFNKCAVKFLYINNNKVTGHTSNSNTGTKNGITYNNNNYVLRYVLGV